MTAGVWLFGSTAMLIGTTFLGAGLYSGAENLLVVLMGLFPPYTCIMATYDGSLFALLLTLLFLYAILFLNKRVGSFLPGGKYPVAT